MYCKFCGKWVEGEGMVCESCAALRGEPGVPAAAPPSPAQPQAPAKARGNAARAKVRGSAARAKARSARTPKRAALLRLSPPGGG